MTPTPAAPLDIVTVMIAIFSAFVGADMATAIATYAVILLSAIGGAAWSAASRVETDRRHTVVYMLCMVGLALIGTVPLAEAVARWTDLNVRWMFAPVAVLIAARPDWIISRLKQIFDRATGQQGGQP